LEFDDSLAGIVGGIFPRSHFGCGFIDQLSNCIVPSDLLEFHASPELIDPISGEHVTLMV